MKPVSRHILGMALVAALSAGAPGDVLHAQPMPATLIADDIRFDPNARAITARGGVEVFYDGTRLRAGAITYSERGDRISVEGPITLTDPDGAVIILADFADLSADFQDGVLQSARLVLDRQLQIAATQIDRTDGRYTQIYQAVASSCEVCFDNPTPLWEIRAERVVHDAEERQLYFTNAQFRVMGVPIAWLPRMRLPDPTLERASGFLAPTIRADDTTGTAILTPYFLTFGQSADLTVTPWIGFGGSQTIELRYRQAFTRGAIEATGALTADELTNAPLRSYVFATGAFDLGHDFVLDFGIQAVSDNGYLTTYGFPDPDLLENYAAVSRVRDDEYIELRGTLYASLRDGDDNDTLPTRLAEGTYTRRFDPAVVGGIGEFTLSSLSYQREEDTPGTTDGDPDATDAARVTAELDWQRSEVLSGGLLATLQAALAADFYSVQEDDDPDLNGQFARLTPYAAVQLRWPMQRTDQSGVGHLLEPVAQLAWSRTTGEDVPAEDSRVVEFDEANLFALDRFPGADRREEGARLNLGLGYTRIDPAGWSAGVTAGFVLRQEDLDQFTPGSGLDGLRSDWLVAAHFTLDDRLQVVNRSIFDQEFEFTSHELALNWSGPATQVDTTYVYLAADPQEGRDETVSEWVLDAAYDLTDSWEAGVNWRYDVGENEPTRAGLALGYVNECVDVEFSLSRRYTSSATLEASTEFGFTVSLAGFGASREGRSQTRTCRP